MGEEISTPPQGDRKRALVDQWFSGKRRIFFLTTTSDFGLGFRERLIYSFLVCQTRFGAAATQAGIARFLGLDRGGTVSKAVDHLVKANLAVRADGGIVALEPTGDQSGWFVSRKTDATDWWDSLAYYPVYLPKPSRSLPPRYNVLLFLLHSLAKRKATAKDQTYRGLGKLLGIDPKTVKNGISRLVDLGLITVFLGAKQSDWFAIGLAKPTNDHLKLFQDIEPGKPDEYVGLEEFVQKSNEEIATEDSDGSSEIVANGSSPKPKEQPKHHDPLCEKYPHENSWMCDVGIPDKSRRTALEVYSHPMSEMDASIFQTYLAKAQEDHQRNQKRGKHLNVNHCGHLLIANLRNRLDRHQKTAQLDIDRLTDERYEEKRLEAARQLEREQAAMERTADYSDPMTAPFNQRLFEERIWGGGYWIPWEKTYGEAICRKGLDIVPHLPDRKDLQRRIGPRAFETVLKQLAAGDEVEKFEVPKQSESSDVKAEVAISAVRPAPKTQESVGRGGPSINDDLDDAQWLRTLSERARARAAIKKPERGIRPAWMEADSAGVLTYVE